MKKSVSPLSLKEPVQGVRKCIPPDFLKFFDSLRCCVSEKFFLIFSRKYCYSLPKIYNGAKTRLWNRPLKTASFQHLYFIFCIFNKKTAALYGRLTPKSENLIKTP